MQLFNLKNASALLLAACSLSLTGCDPNQGNVLVHGTVKLDGNPYPNAQVRFTPEPPAEGRPAFGLTDSEGKYKLFYIKEVQGVPAGRYRVDITTVSKSSSDTDGGRELPEKLPAKYNVRSELKASVEKGSELQDFDLKSK